MSADPSRTFTAPRLRTLLCLSFFVVAGVAALAAIGSSRATGQRVGGNPLNVANKIAPWVIAQTANGQQAEFVLADQADLRPAAGLATKTKKARFVRDALWTKSQATQGSILR
jgi:hypothetical protein